MCGHLYDVSRERIRQIEAKSLKKLKHLSSSLPWEEFETRLTKTFEKLSYQLQLKALVLQIIYLPILKSKNHYLFT